MRISARPMPAIDRLRSLGPLQAATKKDLDCIDRLTCEIKVSAGKVLVTEGCRQPAFFLVLSGCAAVATDGVANGVLGPGMCFGQAAMLADEPGRETVTALTPMLVRVATRGEFAELLEVQALSSVLLQTVASGQPT